MKIVYLMKNGAPVIVNTNEEGEYIYPNDAYTEVEPPAGIYQPFYFDGTRWIGQTKEDWEAVQEKEVIEEFGELTPTTQELVLAYTQKQVGKMGILLMAAQKQLALCIKDSAEKQIRIEELEKSLADTMLEISKLKGGN